MPVTYSDASAATRLPLPAIEGPRPPIISRLDHERLAPFLDGPLTPPRANLRRLLERAELTAPQAMPPDVVTMRSRVLVRDPSDGTVDRCVLSYPDEHEIVGEVCVDVTSPLGAVLLAAVVGAEVRYMGARAERAVVVEALEFQPERDGQWTL